MKELSKSTLLFLYLKNKFSGKKQKKEKRYSLKDEEKRLQDESQFNINPWKVLRMILNFVLICYVGHIVFTTYEAASSNPNLYPGLQNDTSWNSNYSSYTSSWDSATNGTLAVNTSYHYNVSTAEQPIIDTSNFGIIEVLVIIIVLGVLVRIIGRVGI